MLGWWIFQNRSNSARDETQNKTQDLVSAISLNINQNQLEFFARMLDKLGENTALLTKQNNDQDLKFSQLKSNNQEILFELQKQVQEQLARSIQNLLDLNKTELRSIQEINKQNFDLLNKSNQERLNQIQQEIDKRLNENLQQNLKSFEEVTKNLGNMQSTAQRMIDSTKSVEKLNSIFERTSSKGFGQFAETYLESILAENLNTQNWQKQVGPTGSSDKIDFLLLVGEKKIGIDSKFPLTKYQDYIDSSIDDKKSTLQAFLKGVQDMATDISRKYYKNGFIDSLLVYFPSDGMYHEVVNDIGLMENLQKLKVTPVSPTTIFPLIMLIVAYEFKLNVNENADQIIQGLQIIKKNVLSFREEFKKLGEKIRLAQNNYELADKSLLTVQNTVEHLEIATDKQELL